MAYLWGGGIVAVIVVGLLGWQSLDQLARANAVEHIVECARIHGDKDIDAAFVNMEIDTGIQQTGKGWRVGVQYAALSMEASGLSSTGACFVTQETLFSN